MVGGGFSASHDTGIPRITKDWTVFCQAEDYPKILNCCETNGCKIKMTDTKRPAKVFKGIDNLGVDAKSREGLVL